jgi:hypothetical protein
MPFAHGGPGAGRADGERGRRDASLAQDTQDLPRLACDLLLLAGNLRDDVVEDIERHDGERPAPETPCIEVITTRSIPKRSRSGLSVTTSRIVVQFGSGTMKPLQPRRRR